LQQLTARGLNGGLFDRSAHVVSEFLNATPDFIAS